MEEVSWGGCFSYGDNNSVKLNGANITQLLGENGAGKSSIALIIQEAFFNKNSKGVKKADIPNRIGDGSYWIKLPFTLNGKHYVIQVNRKGTLKVKLTENGEDISSHTATDTFKTIESLIGMDFKTFVPLIYQSTTEGLSFLTATDTNRKKFLIDLFGLNEYDTYHVMFKEIVSETVTAVSRIEGQLSSISTWIKKNEALPDKKTLMEVPDIPKDDELWSLKDRINRVKETNKKIESNNKLAEILKSISFDKSLIGQTKEDTSSINMELGGLESEIKSRKALIAKLDSLQDKCPTCEQDIDKHKQEHFLVYAKGELKDAQDRKAFLTVKLAEVTKMNNLITEAKNKQNEWESIYTKIDKTLTKTLEDVNDIQDRIILIEADIRSKKKIYDAAISNNMETEKHNARISVILEQLNEHREELAKVQERLKTATVELGLLEILKKAFSTNGLVAYKLENLVKDLENVTNSYLGELSDGRFTLQFSVTSDKLNVSLTDDGAEIEVAALSSGELARVNTATLLAIRKLMNSISKTQVNILFLDEVMNVLDEFGKDRLVEVLLQEEGLNTFLVSHGWSHPLLQKITVTKEDGESRLNNG
jgi:DNA repair exonuclease SbcCD ATPase subunit